MYFKHKTNSWIRVKSILLIIFETLKLILIIILLDYMIINIKNTVVKYGFTTDFIEKPFSK